MCCLWRFFTRAPGFERVHRDAVARVRNLKPQDMDRSLSLFTVGRMTIRDMLWDMVLLHTVHHIARMTSRYGDVYLRACAPARPAPPR